MKTCLLVLFLLPSLALADCIPWEIQLSQDTLKGCEKDWSLFKQRNLRVTFPDGFTEDNFPAGNGGCGQSTSCDAAGFLADILNGLTECWPLFDEPVRSEGIWSQTVHNQSPSQKLKQCNSTVYTVAGPIECVENPLTMSRTWTVVHSCPGSGGVAATTPSFVWDIPCPWVQTFVSAMPSCLPPPVCFFCLEPGPSLPLPADQN